MQTNELLNKFTRQMRKNITFPDMEKEASPQVVRFLRPAPGMSQILYSDLDDSNADAVIEEQIEYFTAKNLPFSWKVYAEDSPPDLLTHLIARGFTPDPPDAVMVLDLASNPPLLNMASNIDVRQIDSTQLKDVIKVLEQVWGGNFDWIYRRLGAHLAIPDYLSIYVAYTDNTPISTGWIYYPPGSEFASLWGGSTVQRFRSRGFYTAILASRIQEAAGCSKRYLVTDASPMSKPHLAHQEFFQLTSVTQCEYSGPIKPAG